MNDEEVSIQTVAVVAYFKVLSRNSSTIRITSNPTEIPTDYHPTASLKRFGYTNLPGCGLFQNSARTFVWTNQENHNITQDRVRPSYEHSTCGLPVSRFTDKFNLLGRGGYRRCYFTRVILDTDYSPPSSKDVKNAQNFTYASSYFFMMWCLSTGATLLFHLYLTTLYILCYFLLC